MVAGGVCTVLLVVSLAVVAPSRSPLNLAKNSICHGPPLMMFHAFHRCSMNYIIQMPSYKAVYDTNQIPTRAKLLVLSHDRCTEGTIAGIDCFKDRIKDCNATLRAKLNSMLETGVGFLCQPEGGGVEPSLSYVLNSMDDEELEQAVTSRCSVDYNTCAREFVGRGGWRSSLDTVKSTFQGGTERFVRCMAETYQAVKETCPHWRADFLYNSILHVLSYPFLGLRMSFTQQELADMFQL